MEDLYHTLFDLARELLDKPDPDDTARLLLERVRELCGADRGFIVVREGGRFVQKFDVAYDRSTLSAGERQFSRTLVKHALEVGRIVREDDQTLPRAESVEALARADIRVVPLIDASGPVGALYLDRRSELFEAGIDELLGALGPTAARVIARALERDSLRRRNRDLERDLFAQHDFTGIVTRDPRMLALLQTVAQVADSGAPILVRGETGTGKELVARALHVNSARRPRSFVVLHCAALPANLLESELFGHARGAFTGADRDRAGRLAQADGGTIFLDEVAEIAPEVQAKLLRFLQFGEVQRVGTDRIEKLDVRVISATHADLRELAQQRKFRQDLYYRLNGVELVIPPLRERRSDILAIADAVLARTWKRTGERPRFTTRAERALAAYAWPGNVRELEHVIERACLLTPGPEIDADVLPPEVIGGAGDAPLARFQRYDVDELNAAREAAVTEVERSFVAGLLQLHDGNVSQAARASGVNRTYLQKLLAKQRGDGAG